MSHSSCPAATACQRETRSLYVEQDAQGDYIHVIVADERAIILNETMAKPVSDDPLSVAVMAGLWPPTGAVVGAGHALFHDGRAAVTQALGGPETLLVGYEVPVKQQSSKLEEFLRLRPQVHYGLAINLATVLGLFDPGSGGWFDFSLEYMARRLAGRDGVGIPGGGWNSKAQLVMNIYQEYVAAPDSAAKIRKAKGKLFAAICHEVEPLEYVEVQNEDQVMEMFGRRYDAIMNQNNTEGSLQSASV